MADSGRGGDRRQAAKKRKRTGRGAEPDPPTGPSVNGDAGVSSPKKSKKGEAQKAAPEEDKKIEDDAILPSKDGMWDRDSVKTLLDRIGTALPSEDVWKYSTQAERLSWDEVAFGEFTAKDCKEKWQTVITRLRRFRTMTELVHDAHEWCKMPWNSFGKKTSHPDMPKKPLTPYFKFFVTNRVKSAAANPSLSMTDLSKLLSAKFRNLSPEKKQHYVDQYNRENEEYKKAMEKFRKEHPEAAPEGKSGGAPMVPAGAIGKVPKATTPMMIYINAKAQEQIEKGTNLTRKELYEHYRDKWSKLEDKKKLKYINKGIEAKITYDTEMAEYCRNNPGFVPKEVKTFLSKAEQKIHDHYSGKPEKPPPNGYGLYTATIMSQLQTIPASERMTEISRRWKQFSDGEKAAYNKEAEKRNRDYKLQFQAYLEQLSPEERQRVEAESSGGKKKSAQAAASAASAVAATVSPKSTKAAAQSAAQNSPDKPQKPVAAMFIFIEDKENVYKAKHPRMASKELKQLMIKEYNCLPEREKSKYKKMEQERKSVIASTESTNVSTKTPKMHFPGEPKKPPTSAYQLFSADMLSKLVDVPSKDRMTEVSRRWAKTSAVQRQKWQKKKDELMAQYHIDLEKFKKTLSPKDLKKYEEYQKTKGKKSVVKQAVQAAPEEKSSTSDEEESDDESEEEESSEEESEEEESEVEESGEEESEEEGRVETEPKQLEKHQLVQQNGKQIKGKLNTNEVYETDTSDDSDESTETSDSDSNDA